MSSGASEISQSIGQVDIGATQTGKTASEVLTSSKDLSEQSQILKQKVDEFLKTVRAA